MLKDLLRRFSLSRGGRGALENRGRGGESGRFSDALELPRRERVKTCELVINPMVSAEIAPPKSRKTNAPASASFNSSSLSLGSKGNAKTVPISKRLVFPFALLNVFMMTHIASTSFLVRRSLRCEITPASELPKLLGTIVAISSFIFITFSTFLKITIEVCIHAHAYKLGKRFIDKSLYQFIISFFVYYIVASSSGILRPSHSEMVCRPSELPATKTLLTGDCTEMTVARIHANLPMCADLFPEDINNANRKVFVHDMLAESFYGDDSKEMERSEIHSIVEAFREVFVTFASNEESRTDCERVFRNYLCASLVTSECSPDCRTDVKLCRDTCEAMDSACPLLKGLVDGALLTLDQIISIVPDKAVELFIKKFVNGISSSEGCAIPGVAVAATTSNCTSIKAVAPARPVFPTTGNCTHAAVEQNLAKNEAIMKRYNEHSARVLSNAENARDAWTALLLWTLALSYLVLFLIPAGLLYSSRNATDKTWAPTLPGDGKVFTDRFFVSTFSMVIQSAMLSFCLFFSIHVSLVAEQGSFTTFYLVLLTAQIPATYFASELVEAFSLKGCHVKRNSATLIKIPIFNKQMERVEYLRKLHRSMFGINDGKYFFLYMCILEAAEVVVQTDSLNSALSTYDETYCIVFACVIATNCISTSITLQFKNRRATLICDLMFDSLYFFLNSLKVLTLEGYNQSAAAFTLSDAVSLSWPLFSVSNHVQRLRTFKGAKKKSAEKESSPDLPKSTPSMYRMPIVRQNMSLVFSLFIFTWGVLVLGSVTSNVVAQRSSCIAEFGGCVWSSIYPRTYKDGSARGWIFATNYSCQVSFFTSIIVDSCSPVDRVDEWMSKFTGANRMVLNASLFQQYPRAAVRFAAIQDDFLISLQENESIRFADLSYLGLSEIPLSTTSNLLSLSGLRNISVRGNMIQDLNIFVDKIKSKKETSYYLAHFDASQNNLTNIPFSIVSENFMSLIHLNLSSNAISNLGGQFFNAANRIRTRGGSIDISNLPAITTLNWKGINGSWPSFLATLTSLNFLWMQNDGTRSTKARLQGEIPDLSALTNLEYLELEGVDAIAFPTWIGKLARLTDLTLTKFYVNESDALALASLSNLKDLRHMNLGVRINAPLPKLCGLKKLSSYIFEESTVRNQMQPCVFSTGGLLDVFISEMAGATIPTEIGLSTNLQYLQIEGSVSGTIPTQIGKLTHLRVLRSLGGHLNGSFPSQLGKLACLEVFSEWSPQIHKKYIPELVPLRTMRRGVQCGKWPSRRFQRMPDVIRHCMKNYTTEHVAMMCDVQLRTYFR